MGIEMRVSIGCVMVDFLGWVTLARRRVHNGSCFVSFECQGGLEGMSSE
jgi:hypothetical protein